jgi:hypothetical protein
MVLAVHVQGATDDMYKSQFCSVIHVTLQLDIVIYRVLPVYPPSQLYLVDVKYI